MGAAAIARQLGATRQGHNWRCPCPLGCGYALSLSDGEDGRLLAFCFGGCEFDQVMSALVEYGLLDDDDSDSLLTPSRGCRPSAAARSPLSGSRKPGRSTPAASRTSGSRSICAAAGSN